MQLGNSETTLVDNQALLRTMLRERRFGEFDDLIQKMKREGVQFDTGLYNFIIHSYMVRRTPMTCMMYFREMKSNGICPTLDVYNTVISSFVWVRDSEPTFELYEEILDAGLFPTIETFNAMLRVALSTKNDSTVNTILEEMKKRGVDLNLQTYLVLIKSYAKMYGSENAFKWWQLMNKSYQMSLPEFRLPTDVSEQMFKTYFYSSELRGLKELLDYYEIKDVRIPEGMYMRCLEAAARAENPDPDFVEKMWDSLVGQYGATQAGFSALLLAHSLGNEPEKVLQALHDWQPKGYSLHPTVLYHAARSLNGREEVERLWRFINSLSDSVPAGCYNVLLKAMIFRSDSDTVWQRYQEMKAKSAPMDAMTWDTLLHALVSFCDQDRFRDLLRDMEQLGVKLDYLCMEHCIRGEALFGNIDKSLELLREFASSEKPSFGLFHALVKQMIDIGNADAVDEMIKIAGQHHNAHALITLRANRSRRLSPKNSQSIQDIQHT